MNATPTAVRVLTSDIAVYTFTLDNDAYISLKDAHHYVTDQELERANRYHYQENREMYLRGRGYLRKLLGWHMQLPPQRVPLHEALGRKPVVIGNPLHFNLSHSADLAVCAISKCRPVGIDVEKFNITRPEPELCQQVFTSNELKSLSKCENEVFMQCFYAFWTAKEAMMKLTGLGVRLAPKQIELALESGRPIGYIRPTLPRAHLLRIPLSVKDAICHVATPWA